MWQIIRKYPLAVVAAIAAHVVFIVLLTFTFNWDDADPQLSQGDEIEIIKAKAVDEAKIQAELDRLKAEERKRKQALQEQVRKAKEARLKEQRKLAEIKKKQEQEKQRILAKKKAEEKRLAELKKKQRQAEQKRKQEEQRLAELEEKRKQEEAKQQAQREAELKQKLEAEQQQREQQQQQQTMRGAQRQAELNKYRALIKADVTRHWNIPSSAKSGMVCEVRVRLIPSGDVVNVQVIKSSGDAAFDRSVEAAVYRAAPLPVPPANSGLFDDFREVIFSFDPKQRL